MQTVVESLEASRIPFVIYDRVRIEPSDESFLDAIAFARIHPFDAIVAVDAGKMSLADARAKIAASKG